MKTAFNKQRRNDFFDYTFFFTSDFHSFVAKMQLSSV